ncbi:hypothetical protein [Oribacterium sp. oral taxon 078]|uniref:hypothetical protein n=1 Tax=Oribacterium sp. oral taxon 078 TaxID=652706 RepID=UPI0001BCC4E2|nr:hypothetical protein [Oribacterium sp. oral taxon 078]
MRREEDWISERRGGETELPGWFWRLIFLPGYIRRLLLLLSLFLSSLLYFSLRWMLSNWSELSVEEILYHLKAPMQGASSALLRSYLLFALLPALLLLLLFLLFSGAAVIFSSFILCAAFFFFFRSSFSFSRFGTAGRGSGFGISSCLSLHIPILSTEIMSIRDRWSSVFRRRRGISSISTWSPRR